MPEGHTVHRAARHLDRWFCRHPLTVTSPQGRFSAGAGLLDGRVMDSAHAVGKQLFCGFGGQWLHVHLGLYGAWQFGGAGYAGPASIGAPRTAGPGDPTTVRVRLVTQGPAGGVWAELRGPSRCEVLDDEERRRVESLLGPDPIGTLRGCDGEPEFARRLGTRRGAVGALLLDQRIVSGVGNVYRAEALFRAGLDPRRPGTGLDAAELHGLWRELRDLLAEGLRVGRIVTTTPAERAATGQERYVYGRAGESCLRCGGTLRAETIAGRALAWCPGCQG